MLVKRAFEVSSTKATLLMDFLAFHVDGIPWRTLTSLPRQLAVHHRQIYGFSVFNDGGISESIPQDWTIPQVGWILDR